MTCQTCGTEIADKALICYRCGTATAAPRVPPPASRRASGGFPWRIAALALLLLAAAALWWWLQRGALAS
ncbi:MAG: hypothetical protein FJW29_08105 [Acidobacteria bacterium]|nr:hypothetical protein [Acidobacteriota bacterium]